MGFPLSPSFPSVTPSALLIKVSTHSGTGAGEGRRCEGAGRSLFLSCHGLASDLSGLGQGLETTLS